MIQLSDGSTTIELPADLQWVDEFGWSKVQQESERSITGALVVQQGEKLKGRPMTLQSNGASWVTRATVEALQAYYDQVGQECTLTIDGVDYPFQFERPGGFSAEEVQRLAHGLQGSDHYYTIQIKGFEVAP